MSSRAGHNPRTSVSRRGTLHDDSQSISMALINPADSVHTTAHVSPSRQDDRPVTRNSHTQQTDGSDTDYDTDLDTTDKGQEFDISGRHIYVDSCKKLGVTPAKFFLQNMQSERVNLCHHGLGPSGTVALSYPLQMNTFVTDLNLSDNFIGSEGVAAICWMLQENVYVTTLNLSGNKLGSRGAFLVSRMLLQNITLTFLDISANDITDQDGESLALAISENKTLLTLNMSKNYLGPNSAVALGQAMQDNDCLTNLDLSWNHFRYKSTLPICKFVKVNTALATLNLSFLGLGKEGGKVLADSLSENACLRELWIDDCRLGGDGATLLSKSLAVNTTLKTLHMCNNNIGVSAAIALLTALSKHTDSALELLNLGTMEVTKQYVEVETLLVENNPIIIKRGALISDYIIKGIYVEERTMFGLKYLEFEQTCPLLALRNYAVEQDIEEFHIMIDQLLKHSSTKIDVDELMYLITNPRFRLTHDQRNKYELRLDALKDSENVVDVTALVPTTVA